MKNLILVIGLIFLASCSSTPTTIRDRAPASDGELFWMEHPCGEKSGVPFRKYHSFALDEYKGVLYARTSPTANPTEIKDRPPSGYKYWGSVTEFFEAKGILSACGTAATDPKPPKPPRDQEQEGDNDREPPVDTSGFVEPVNFNLDSYYQALNDLSARQTMSGSQFKLNLQQLLARPHLQKKGAPDQIVDACPQELKEGEACIKQRTFTYESARVEMMGNEELGDLRQNEAGDYELFDHYCQKWQGKAEFQFVGVAANGMPAPRRIVDHKLMNCEHTWPQSKFPSPKNSRANLVEKTDLHHIFPTDTKINAVRGNYDFAEVDRNGAKKQQCNGGPAGHESFLGNAIVPEGVAAAKNPHFEPPTEHKGNVARALMYFSTRYNAGMTPLQEYYLRKWHRQDPPDAREIKRNEGVYKTMGVRNPFIDHPEWVDRVLRFCRVKLSTEQAATENDCQ